jgi:DNA-binding NtrC family response regulator
MQLPPLRERMDDIPVLCGALLEELNRKHATQVTEIGADAMEVLKRHQWPGNVRELRNALERAVILAGEGAVQSRHLPPSLLPALPQGEPAQPPAIEDFVMVRLGATIEDAERALILRTVQLTKGNKTRASEILGITLKTLMNKLNKYEESSSQAG